MARSYALLFATLAVLPRLASAQHRGTIELGGFARYGVYDSQLNLDDAPGAGASLGWFLSGKMILEADAALAPTKSSGVDIDHKPFHVRLVGNLPVGKRLAFLLGGGWAYNSFSNGLSETENGVGGLAGLRLSLGKRLSVRGQATADYMFDQASAVADPTLHYALQAGVSLMLRGGPGDKDKDGIKDNLDRCGGTPEGTPVEATGCPDEDRDGVADQVDRCKGTPAGRAVDAIGCTDSDGDGVVDPQDRCDGTRAGTAVDANGCPVDADGDGVLDAQDKCLGTAANIMVGPTGCPADADADGVADVTDACPDTPAGSTVDSKGCSAVPVSAATSAPVVLVGVSFLSGSAKLTLNSQVPLNRGVTELQQNPDSRFLIEGHTDNVGNREANIRLSKARADAVRAYFISKGVAASRLTTVGIGPDQPVASNDSAEGRATNRRVQLRAQP